MCKLAITSFHCPTHGPWTHAQNPYSWLFEYWKCGCSFNVHIRYLAQNAAIWLADEVLLRYCDQDTLRSQDKISWHLIHNSLKNLMLIMVCVLLWETVNPLTCIFEQKHCQCHSMFSKNLYNSTNYKLLR